MSAAAWAADEVILFCRGDLKSISQTYHTLPRRAHNYRSVFPELFSSTLDLETEKKK